MNAQAAGGRRHRRLPPPCSDSPSSPPVAVARPRRTSQRELHDRPDLDGAPADADVLRVEGGTLKILSAGDVDHIDPGQAYYSFSYEITTADAAARSSTRSPATIDAPARPGRRACRRSRKTARPSPSRSGKAFSFSPPVNREVTSADVKYAIERGFSTSVANGYAAAYFGVSRARPKTPPTYPRADLGHRDAQPEHDRVPPDPTRGGLRHRPVAAAHRSRARGATRSPSTTRAVSTYGLHQVATGPYMIKNNAAGTINGVGYKPQPADRPRPQPELGREHRLPARVRDEIRFQEGYQDPTVHHASRS